MYTQLQRKHHNNGNISIAIACINNHSGVHSTIILTKNTYDAAT